MSMAEKKSSLSKAAFAKLHGIPRIMVNNIFSSKSSSKEFKNGRRKWQPVSPFDKIEESLLIWIKIARSQNVPISSSIIRNGKT